jgi:ATP:cob(I)alamin adenosyltransferase
MATKIYTKTGDDGTTGLFGGARLPKDHIRIEAYGTVDELNASIGWLMSCQKHPEINIFLQNIQSRLFTVGSNLASDPDKEMITPDLSQEDISIIEHAIDVMQNELPPLKHFILPGGSSSGECSTFNQDSVQKSRTQMCSLIPFFGGRSFDSFISQSPLRLFLCPCAMVRQGRKCGRDQMAAPEK